MQNTRGKIKEVEYWGKSRFQDVNFMSHHFNDKPNDKPIDWVATKRFMYGTEFVQHFVNVKGFKFNWLIKLWSKLNNL